MSKESDILNSIKKLIDDMTEAGVAPELVYSAQKIHKDITGFFAKKRMTRREPN